MARSETVNAIVTNVEDPEKRGRIRVRSRELVADGVELPDWIEPCFPYAGASCGWFFLPPVGAGVLLEHDTGSDFDDVRGQSGLANPRYRWRSGLYLDTDEVPEVLRESYGKRFGVVTPKGAFVLFEETLGEIWMHAQKIRIGGEKASEPLVLGQVFLTFAGALLDAVIGHTHSHTDTGSPLGTGVTGPPLNAATFSGLKTSYVDGKTLVSGVAFTQKAPSSG